MGTHPIFESDFDCLTVLERDKMHSFIFNWRVKLALSKDFELENDAAFISAVQSDKYNQLLEAIVQKENIPENDHARVDRIFERAKKAKSYGDRIVGIANLIEAAWESDSSFDVDWRKHYRETAKLEMKLVTDKWNQESSERRRINREKLGLSATRDQENGEPVDEQMENDEDRNSRNDEFNGDDSGINMDLSNIEYFLQRSPPDSLANQRAGDERPSPNWVRLAENVEKFKRVRDKIMRIRELNIENEQANRQLNRHLNNN